MNRNYYRDEKKKHIDTISLILFLSGPSNPEPAVGLVGMNKIKARTGDLFIPLFIYSTNEGTMVGCGDSGANGTD